MVQGIGKLSLKMGVLLRGSVYEQKKCVRSPSVFITLGTYPRSNQHLVEIHTGIAKQKFFDDVYSVKTICRTFF